jgi:hypothetical protein
MKLYKHMIPVIFDSAVVTATGYRLDMSEVGIWVPVESINFSSLHHPRQFWCPSIPQSNNGFVGVKRLEREVEN